MSVFVDVLVDYGRTPRWRFGEACHMWADSESELHAFAARLGLKREWFQPGKILPHYDLTKSKRALAVKLGAVEDHDGKLVREAIRRQRALRAEATA